MSFEICKYNVFINIEYKKYSSEWINKYNMYELDKIELLDYINTILSIVDIGGVDCVVEIKIQYLTLNTSVEREYKFESPQDDFTPRYDLIAKIQKQLLLVIEKE